MVSKRLKNLALGIFTLICLFIFNGASGQKKNLLFIMTDQQRFDALSRAGNTVIKTPNLDRLAQSGVYFKNAYAPCAVCGPSRASILTGCTVENTGVFSNSQTYSYKDESVMTMPTFDEILNHVGYRCEYYGKWHTITSKGDIYQNPRLTVSGGRSIFDSGGAARSFRDYLSTLGPIPATEDGQFIDGISKYPYIPDPIDEYYGWTIAEMKAQGLEHSSQPDQVGRLLMDAENSETAFEAKEAIEALERLKDETFSITCSFHFPHAPFVVPDPYHSMYPPDDIPMPASINDDMQNSPYKTSNSRMKNTRYKDPDKLKHMISTYYGLVSEIDYWVGEILDKVDELGLTDNTLIIFTSDHGEMLGAHGMRSKNIFLDESAHIPLLISSPGQIPEGTTVDGYVSLIDLFPTILDYLDVPEQVSDGKSLRGLINGTDEEHGEYVVTEWDRESSPNYMVIKDGWKLIIPYTIQSTVINAMYDLNTDPYEMNNLLGSNPNCADYQDKAEELRACLVEWLEDKNSVHTYSVSKRDLLNGGKPTGNNASFVSQIIPEFVKGEKVSVSITMKNTGITTWVPEGNFKLVSQSPAKNNAWGISEVTLDDGESIAPNEEKTFTFEITVPSFDGTYNFQWQMLQEGEEWFGSKSEIEQLIFGDPGSYLDECDEKTDWEKSSLITLINSGHKQGSGCLEYTGDESSEFKKAFLTSFNPEMKMENAALEFWYYVSDISVHESSNQVELGSAGKNDEDEFNWKLTDLSNGWNYIRLKFSEAGTMGNPDFNAINWFRIYHKKTGELTSKVDAIMIVDLTAVSSPLIVDTSLDKPRINIYPNPLKGNVLFIDLDGFQHYKNIDITITNLSGQTVFQTMLFDRKKIEIDTKELLKDTIYFVTVKDRESRVTEKLIAQ